VRAICLLSAWFISHGKKHYFSTVIVITSYSERMNILGKSHVCLHMCKICVKHIRKMTSC